MIKLQNVRCRNFRLIFETKNFQWIFKLRFKRVFVFSNIQIPSTYTIIHNYILTSKLKCFWNCCTWIGLPVLHYEIKLVFFIERTHAVLYIKKKRKKILHSTKKKYTFQLKFQMFVPFYRVFLVYKLSDILRAVRNLF